VKDNEYKIATCMRDLPQDFFGGQWTFYHSYAATPSIFPSALAMTRALGDKRMKAYGVSAEPESLEPQKIDENSLIVLMSDGVTDAYTDDDIVAKISHLMAATDIDYYRGFKEPDCLVGNNARLQHVVRVMGDFVLRQSRDSDNVTLMLIQKAKNQAGENHDEKNEK
jgi:serine/threonine protein phosphatase PrpC